MTWSEITESYAGLFFRAVGGGSAAFGSIQDDNSPRLTNVQTGSVPHGIWQTVVNADNTLSSLVSTGHGSGIDHWGLSFRVSQTEVRPRNTAIRIWIRTA